MELIITLRKEVDDETEAQTNLNFVVNKLVDKPEIKITGQVSSKLTLDPG